MTALRTSIERTGSTPEWLNSLWWRPDPRTLLLSMLILNALVMGNGPLLVSLVTGALALTGIALLGRWRLFAGIGSWIVLGAALAVLLPQLSSSTWAATLAIIGFWTMRFSIAVALAAFIIASVRPGQLVAALNRLHLPRAIVIPFAVMMRFLPVARAEYEAVTDAMALRGLNPGLGLMMHPLRTLEFILVPLLVSSSRIADDLTASALVRGLGRPGRPTSINPLSFSWPDFTLLVLVGLIICLQFSGWEVPL